MFAASMFALLVGTSCEALAQAPAFSYDKSALPGAKPWTSKSFQNNPQNFRFAIIGDRTGGANAEGTFEMAMDQVNLLQPEFVINVGDAIEGYSDEKAELHAEWDEVDAMLNKLDMPFFRTLGNHDIANEIAQEV
jgi:Calcineurin-like phosphoesterase